MNSYNKRIEHVDKKKVQDHLCCHSGACYIRLMATCIFGQLSITIQWGGGGGGGARATMHSYTADSSTFAIEKQLGLKPHVAVSHRQPCRNSLHSSTRVVFRCSQSVAKVPKLAVVVGTYKCTG